jgi:hypothetical protein
MKMTNRQIDALGKALAALDGDPQPDGTVKRYDISGKVLYAIARTINHLRPHLQAFTQARNAIVAKYSGGKAGLAPEDPNHQRCVAELDELLDTEVEAELHRFKLDDLKLDANRIPAWVLAALEPVLLID